MQKLKFILVAILVITLLKVCSTYSYFIDEEVATATLKAGVWCKCDDIKIKKIIKNNHTYIKLKNIGCMDIKIIDVLCENGTTTPSLENYTLYPGEFVIAKVEHTKSVKFVLDDKTTVTVDLS